MAADRCHDCGAALEQRTIDYQTRARDPDTGEERRVVVEQLAVLECPSCGERVFDSAAVDRVDEARARAFNLLSPEEILALRRRLGLSQAQMAQLLGLGAKTLTRWESGRLAPSRSMNNFLRLVEVMTSGRGMRELLLSRVLGPGLSRDAKGLLEKVRAAAKTPSEVSQHAKAPDIDPLQRVLRSWSFATRFGAAPDQPPSPSRKSGEHGEHAVADELSAGERMMIAGGLFGIDKPQRGQLERVARYLGVSRRSVTPWRDRLGGLPRIVCGAGAELQHGAEVFDLLLRFIRQIRHSPSLLQPLAPTDWKAFSWSCPVPAEITEDTQEATRDGAAGLRAWPRHATELLPSAQTPPDPASLALSALELAKENAALRRALTRAEQRLSELTGT